MLRWGYFPQDHELIFCAIHIRFLKGVSYIIQYEITNESPVQSVNQIFGFLIQHSFNPSTYFMSNHICVDFSITECDTVPSMWQLSLMIFCLFDLIYIILSLLLFIVPILQSLPVSTWILNLLRDYFGGNLGICNNPMCNGITIIK